MKRGIWVILLLGILIIGSFVLLLYFNNNVKSIEKNETEFIIFNKVEMANPSSTYCSALGYNISDGEGEGSCIFPDGTKCEEWAFYRGICGQKWSYCELKNYDLKNLSETEGWGADGSICVNRTTKEEIGNVFNLINQAFCINDTDCILVFSGCPQCFPCEAISIVDERVLAVNKHNYQCPSHNGSVVCAACAGSTDYNPNKDVVCINNKCTKKTKDEIMQENLEDIFYNSQCYKDNPWGVFNNTNISFKIDKIYNTTIMKTGKNYTFDSPKGNFTEIDIFWNGRTAGDTLTSSINYPVIEKQNVIAWRVQGGIFSSGGAGSFGGCLEIIDSKSRETLAQGYYGYV